MRKERNNFCVFCGSRLVSKKSAGNPEHYERYTYGDCAKNLLYCCANSLCARVYVEKYVLVNVTDANRIKEVKT